VKLLRSIHLGNLPNWEVGVCNCHVLHRHKEALNAVVTQCAGHPMIYCNLISQHSVGDSMRTFRNASSRQHEFRNVQYVALEQRQFQSIRIEFLSL
jgi:hypothetical protein